MITSEALSNAHPARAQGFQQPFVGLEGWHAHNVDAVLHVKVRPAASHQPVRLGIGRIGLRLFLSMRRIDALYPVQPEANKAVEEGALFLLPQTDAAGWASMAMPPVAWIISIASSGEGRQSAE